LTDGTTLTSFDLLPHKPQVSEMGGTSKLGGSDGGK